MSTTASRTDQLITDAGGVARFVQADASQPADIDRMVEAALDLGGGRLDVIVNNAVANGPGAGGLLETTEEDWDLVLGVGLRGVFLCCQRAVRQMLTQEPYGEVRGRIINISSQHGMVGAPGALAYSSMKGGVVNLTRQIAVDFAEAGHRLQRDRARQDRGPARGRRRTPPSSRTPTTARRGRPWAHPRTSPHWRSSWPPTTAAS